MKTRVLIFLFLVIAAAALLGASGSGHLPPGALFAASLVNFALFLFVLIRFGKKPISSFFVEREEKIRAAFEAYRADYERTEAEITHLRKAIAALPEEKERTLADYRRRADELYAARMEEARANAAYIRQASEALMRSAAQERYLSTLAAFADRFARDLAERARSLDTAHHFALVRSCAELFDQETR